MPTDIFRSAGFPSFTGVCTVYFLPISLFFYSQNSGSLLSLISVCRFLLPAVAAEASSPEGAAQREGLPASVLPSSPKQKMQNSQVIFKPRMLDIMDIRAHGEHPEKSGKNILSLGHPCYGFHVERVKGKQSRYESALPGRFGHPVKNEKEQQCICNVE